MDVIVNRSFIYKLRPERIVILAVLFLAACLLFGPIDPVNTFTLYSSSYIFLCILSFLLGTRLVKNRKLPDATIHVRRRRILIIYWVTFILGLTGVLLKIYDYISIRNLAFLLSDEGSSDGIEGGGTLISITSGILCFFAYIPITLDKVIKGFHGKITQTIAIIVFFSTAINVLINGSRFSMVVPLIYFLFLLGYNGSLSLKFTKKNLLRLFVVVLIFGYLIGGVFLIRLEIMGQDPVDKIKSTTSYPKYVPATDNFANIMEYSKGTFAMPFLFAYSNIVQYEAHGILEFPFVMDYIEKRGNHFYGAASFTGIAKFIAKISGSKKDWSYEIVENYALRPGIWATYFYTWYLDFGWWGVFFMYFMGLFAKLAWKMVYYKKNILFTPIMILSAIIWCFIMNLNLIGGIFFYGIFVFLLVPFSCRWFSVKDNNRIRTLK